MFLRFLKMLIVIFFVFTVVTWPILLPLAAADVPGSRSDGLDKLSWGKFVTTLPDQMGLFI